MSEQDTSVVESNETPTEELEANQPSDESVGEGETKEEGESVQPPKAETPEQRQSRIKRQVERDAKKAGISVEEYLGLNSQKASQEGSEKEVGDERYHRLELKTEGVTSKKAQDVVLEYAKFKGIDVVEALKSPIIKAEIAELEKKTAAPAPSKRTSAGATDSFEYWKAQARKGNWPRHDRVMMDRLKKARVFTS